MSPVSRTVIRGGHTPHGVLVTDGDGREMQTVVVVDADVDGGREPHEVHHALLNLIDHEAERPKDQR